MTGRAAAVRNRLIVAVVAVLLAWLFAWTSDEGLLMLLVAVIAGALALARAWFGGLGVLAHWVLRYRSVDIGLRGLGDIIGEHHDDMQRAGLVVPHPRRYHQALWSWRRRRQPRPMPDLVPGLRHRPHEGGILVSLEAVRAGMSQDDIVRAVPRLRSAWGVDVIQATARPGGRIVDLWIPLTPEGKRRVEASNAVEHEEQPLWRQAQRAAVPERESARPPDAPTIVVAGGKGTARPPREVPPTFRPRLQPDERGRYELTMLPADAARTFAPRPLEDPQDSVEDNPRTDEIPVIDEPASIPPRKPAPAVPSRVPELNGGDRRNPTDVDERDLRVGVHWRVGKER